MHQCLLINGYLFFNYSSIGFDIPKIVCASPLGMENGKIPDSAIVASSRHNQYWGPERGRLNEKTEGNSSASRMFRLWHSLSLAIAHCALQDKWCCVFHTTDPNYNAMQHAGQGLRLYGIVNDNCVLFRTKRNLSNDHPC